MWEARRSTAARINENGEMFQMGGKDKKSKGSELHPA